MSATSVEGRLEGVPLEAQEVLRELADALNELRERHGRGGDTPEGARVGYKGYTWERTDGGAGSCYYIFEGVDGAASGWVAK